MYNTGNHTEAMKNFEKVLTLNFSTSNRSLFDKGVSYYGLGNYQDAIDYFKKALEVDPNNTLTLNNLGFALDISGNHTEAIQYFDLATLINPNNANAFYGKVFGCRSTGIIELRHLHS